MFSEAGEIVIRLMTPRGVRYEDAYAQAHPFDHLVEGMMHGGMVEDTRGVMKIGIAKGVTVNVVINNRAGGNNAPMILRMIAEAFAGIPSVQ